MTCKCEHWQACPECNQKRDAEVKAIENVTAGRFGRPVLTELRNAIKEAIYVYDGRISLAEAIGLLEIVKHELLGEHQ